MGSIINNKSNINAIVQSSMIIIINTRLVLILQICYSMSSLRLCLITTFQLWKIHKTVICKNYFILAKGWKQKSNANKRNKKYPRNWGYQSYLSFKHCSRATFQNSFAPVVKLCQLVFRNRETAEIIKIG